MSGWIRGAISACLLAMLFTVLAPNAPHALATPPVQSEAGEFRMIVGEPSSLDPNIATDFSIYVTSQLFDTLYRLQDDGSLKMLGAESYEVWSYPGLVDSRTLGDRRVSGPPPLVRGGGQISERGMPPVRVVKPFDVIE